MDGSGGGGARRTVAGLYLSRVGVGVEGPHALHFAPKVKNLIDKRGRAGGRVRVACDWHGIHPDDKNSIRFEWRFALIVSDESSIEFFAAQGKKKSHVVQRLQHARSALGRAPAEIASSPKSSDWLVQRYHGLHFLFRSTCDSR